MKRTIGTLCLAAAAALVPLGATHAASSHVAVILHPAAQFKSNAHFMHVMGTAKVRYAKGDAYINLTVNNLPMAASIGKRAYVLYAGDGAMTDRVGALHLSGHMAGVNGEVMMAKVQNLYVYAESNAQDMHPHGTLVLSAMV